MSAAKIQHFYKNPGVEKRMSKLHSSVDEVSRHTDRLLAMSNMLVVDGLQFYLTFDEVVIDGNTAYCIVRKHPRKGTKEFHFLKCKHQVAVMGALFEESNKKLATVKVLTDSGFKLQQVDLNDKDLVFVLEYGEECLDIVSNIPLQVQWAIDKMTAINGKVKDAQSFDAKEFPSNVSWDLDYVDDDDGGRDKYSFHVWVNFLEIIGTTEKSVHVKYTDDLNLWIPKSICKSRCDEGAYVHEETFNAIKKEVKERMYGPKKFKKPFYN